jgi:hypothetical protein
LSQKSEQEIDNAFLKLSWCERQRRVASTKLLREVRDKNLYQRRKENKENYDDENKKHSELSERDWRQRDIVDTQEHQDHKETLKIAYI